MFQDSFSPALVDGELVVEAAVLGLAVLGLTVLGLAIIGSDGGITNFMRQARLLVADDARAPGGQVSGRTIN